MYNDKPAFGMTGTNGKTTSLLLTGFIMQNSGLRPAVLDSWRGSLHFKRFLDNINEGDDCLLLEVPVEALRHHNMSGYQFQVGALLNLAADFDARDSTKQYYKLIRSFFNNLPEGTKAIFNADDPQALTLAQEGRQDLITYATEYSNAMIIANNIRRQGLAATFDLTVNAEFVSLRGNTVRIGSYPAHLPLAGVHNISNALLAATFCLLMDIEPKIITEALARFPGVRRKLEIIYNNDFLVLDDSAGNPAAIKAVISTVSELQRRVIILHGIAGGQGTSLNHANARQLAGWLHNSPDNMLIVTRSMYHCKNKHKVDISEEKAFLAGLKEENQECAYFPDLPDAVESAASHLRSGDILLLLGGPVLNRGRWLLAQIIGDDMVKGALVPSDLASSPPPASAQEITANPT